MRAPLAALLALSACGDPAKEIIDSATRFRDQMCACKDQACIDSVIAARATWTAGERESLRARAESSADYFLDERTASREADACFDRVARSLVPPPPPPAVDDAAVTLTDADAPFPPSKPIDVDKAVRLANDWAKERRNGVTAQIEINYVDANGALDTDDGVIEIGYGQGPTDDPTRKTGAPIKQPDFARECFKLVLAKGTWVRRDDWSCGTTFRARATCSTFAVMKKAAAAGAPADALAQVALRGTTKLTWDVRVDDDLRNVHFLRFFPDDCPLSVEQSAK